MFRINKMMHANVFNIQTELGMIEKNAYRFSILGNGGETSLLFSVSKGDWIFHEKVAIFDSKKRQWPF